MIREREGMKLNLSLIAKKDGLMSDGSPFCYKNYIYHGTVLSGTEEEGGDFYYVEDECNDDPLSELHGMDKEFFDEYFEVKVEKVPWIDKFKKYILKLKKSLTSCF